MYFSSIAEKFQTTFNKMKFKDSKNMFTITFLSSERACYNIVTDHNICIIRVFQCDKSYKVQIFSPVSNSTSHMSFITTTFFDLMTIFEVAHHLQSFMKCSMKWLILKKKFWLKNCTSNPPNDLNLQHIPYFGPNFEKNIEFEFLPPGGYDF